jgi:hypothetical protein
MSEVEKTAAELRAFWDAADRVVQGITPEDTEKALAEIRERAEQLPDHAEGADGRCIRDGDTWPCLAAVLAGPDQIR